MTCLLSENAGKELEYLTEDRFGSGNYVRSAVVSLRESPDDWYLDNDSGLPRDIFQVPDSAPDGKNYEWIGVRSVIRSNQPCCWVLSYEDFYTQDQYDSRDVRCGAGNGFNYKTAAFSLTCNGTVYEDCRMVLIIRQPRTVSEGAGFETEVTVFYRVPEGYDGCLLGFHNSSALTREQIEKGMSDPAACLGRIKEADGDLYIRLK